MHPPPYSSRTISFCPFHANGRVFFHVPASSIRYSTSTRLDTRRVLLGNNYSSTASFSTISSLLTLFSKFFSSFLRSTCMLSVSYKYLALGEVYLPLRAAIPNYPTLRNHSYCFFLPEDGAFTLSGALFQGTYGRLPLSDWFHRLQFYVFNTD